MSTLKELVAHAKTLNYNVQKEERNWEDDDYLFYSISDFLRDERNVKSVSIITKLFPPIIIVFKTFIKRYIKVCETHNNTNISNRYDNMS